jgi:hypothetical protein
MNDSSTTTRQQNELTLLDNMYPDQVTIIRQPVQDDAPIGQEAELELLIDC